MQVLELTENERRLLEEAVAILAIHRGFRDHPDYSALKQIYDRLRAMRMYSA